MYSQHLQYWVIMYRWTSLQSVYYVAAMYYTEECAFPVTSGEQLCELCLQHLIWHVLFLRLNKSDIMSAGIYLHMFCISFLQELLME